MEAQSKTRAALAAALQLEVDQWEAEIGRWEADVNGARKHVSAAHENAATARENLRRFNAELPTISSTEPLSSVRTALGHTGQSTGQAVLVTRGSERGHCRNPDLECATCPTNTILIDTNGRISPMPRTSRGAISGGGSLPPINLNNGHVHTKLSRGTDESSLAGGLLSKQRLGTESPAMRWSSGNLPNPPNSGTCITQQSGRCPPPSPTDQISGRQAVSPNSGRSFCTMPVNSAYASFMESMPANSGSRVTQLGNDPLTQGPRSDPGIAIPNKVTASPPLPNMSSGRPGMGLSGSGSTHVQSSRHLNVTQSGGPVIVELSSNSAPDLRVCRPPACGRTNSGRPAFSLSSDPPAFGSGGSGGGTALGMGMGRGSPSLRAMLMT